MKQQWKSGLAEIAEIIKGVEKKTRDHLTSAYDEAYYCDHGCECQFVEGQYTMLLEKIESLEADIGVWKADIDVVQAKIDGVPYSCDFSALETKFTTQWADLASQS